MPHPRRDRMVEIARKGVELGLRTAAQAPEQRAARALAVRDAWVGGETGYDRAPRVLFVTPRDWAAHVQYESVMAHALRRRGADVRFLTCGGGLEICDRANVYEAPAMPCRTCTRYVHASLDAHGHRATSLRAAWDDGFDDDWPELDLLDREQLEALEVDGVPLGRLVKIPVRWFLCAADVADDPLAALTTRAFLRSARRIMRAAAVDLDRERPDVVVLLNGLFLFESIVWALCRARGIDVVTYERAFVRETLVFSRHAPAGVYDFSTRYRQDRHPLDASEADQLDAYLEQRRVGGADDQFWTFADRDWSEGSGRLVALFTNLTWDTAVLDRDLAFDDIHTWLDAAVEHFRDRPADRLVIRVHPSEVHLPGKRTRDSLEEYLRRRFPILPSNVTVVSAADPSSSYPLMDAADVGLVYTSTTGLELALRGTPVIVAGETHYRGKGFTIDVETPEEFHAALDKALAAPDAVETDVTAAREYAHFFFFRAPVHAPGVREPLPGLARLDLRSLADLDPGVDERVDRICDEILGDGATRAGTATR
ncbi:MAG: capsular polysaccharide export protein, LipB/KpsS family [Acidimicrobiia bacterium]